MRRPHVPPRSLTDLVPVHRQRRYVYRRRFCPQCRQEETADFEQQCVVCGYAYD